MVTAVFIRPSRAFFGVVSSEVFFLETVPTLKDDVAAHVQRVGEAGAPFHARRFDKLGRGEGRLETQLGKPRLPQALWNLRPLSGEGEENYAVERVPVAELTGVAFAQCEVVDAGLVERGAVVGEVAACFQSFDPGLGFLSAANVEVAEMQLAITPGSE